MLNKLSFSFIIKAVCAWKTWNAWSYKSCGDGKAPKNVTGVRNREVKIKGDLCPPGDARETGSKQCPGNTI